MFYEADTKLNKELLNVFFNELLAHYVANFPQDRIDFYHPTHRGYSIGSIKRVLKAATLRYNRLNPLYIKKLIRMYEKSLFETIE